MRLRRNLFIIPKIIMYGRESDLYSIGLVLWGKILEKKEKRIVILMLAEEYGNKKI